MCPGPARCNVHAITLKPSEDTTLTEMAYVCSKRVDEAGTSFPDPPFWMSCSCQSLTAVLLRQVLYAHFLNIWLHSLTAAYRRRRRQRKQSDVCKHIEPGIQRPDWTTKWHTVSLACVNVWVFEVPVHSLHFTNMQIQACEAHSYRQHLNNPAGKHPGKVVPLRFKTEAQVSCLLLFPLYLSHLENK